MEIRVYYSLQTGPEHKHSVLSLGSWISLRRTEDSGMSPDPLTKTGRGKTSVIVTITGQAIARNENTKIKMGKVLLRI